MDIPSFSVLVMINIFPQELTIRQEMGDIKGECKAHGHLGAVHMSLANYTNAMKCYEEQLERAKELKVRSDSLAALSWCCKYSDSLFLTSPFPSASPITHPSPSSLCLFPILYHHSQRHTSSSFTHHLPLIVYRLAYLPPLHPSHTPFPFVVIMAPSIHPVPSCHYFLPFPHPLASLPS